MTGAPRRTGAAPVRAIPPDERLDRDGEAIALVGTDVVRLSALAVVVLDACPSWTDPTELAPVLVARFGPPEGDPVAAVQSVLDALVGRRLLEEQSPAHG